MKVLFLDSPSFGKSDMIEAFQRKRYTVELFDHKGVFDYGNCEFEEYFDALILNGQFDFVFTFNYYPSIANGCHKHQIKYLSFVYDSPFVALYSYTIIHPTNYVFIFDRASYLRFAKEGIPTVYYLPLCANTKRLDRMQLPIQKRPIVTSDVSFVGSLYNEKHNLMDRLKDLDDYTKGYLDGLMKSQLLINGYFFIEDLLTDQILKAMKNSLEYHTLPGGTEPDSYVYANYFIARKLTSIERIDLLDAVSKQFQTKLYTHNETPQLPFIQNMGAIDWYNEMPHIFKNSKINLNITLRSIHSGIPLRAFDIMGAGGFLLTNYQSDFVNYFVPDEDFVYYDGKEDLLGKIEYYLSHEKERLEIAKNGHQKVASSHTYDLRAGQMLQTAGLDG